jgi:hypothetical protein
LRKRNIAAMALPRLADSWPIPEAELAGYCCRKQIFSGYQWVETLQAVPLVPFWLASLARILYPMEASHASGSGRALGWAHDLESWVPVFPSGETVQFVRRSCS